MRTFKMFLAVFLVAFLFQGSMAQEIEKDKLTVYGKVRVFAKTDRASISFDIQGYGKSLKIAFDNAKTQMDTISQKLFAIGLTEDEFSTTFFRNTENFGKKAFLSSKKDFRTKMTASIITRRLELLEPIIIALSESNIEGIDYISFELIDYSKLRMEGLKRAVVKAKEKADMISEILEIEYGDVIELEEIKAASPVMPSRHSSGYPNPFNEAYQMPIEYMAQISLDSEGPSSIFARELRFDSEVKLVLEILSKEKRHDLGEHTDLETVTAGS